IVPIQNNPYVFPSPITGRPCESLHFPWHRIRTRAGLADVRLHDLRHSFASTLVNEDVSLYRVQRLLGHVNAKATQRYAHLSNEVLTDAAEKMGAIVRPLLGKKSSYRLTPFLLNGRKNGILSPVPAMSARISSTIELVGFQSKL